MPILGVIGGSGLYGLEELQNVREEALDTPYGAPSDAYIVGEIGDTTLVFLPRHGRGHKLLPSELNFCANIYGMKKLGVEMILSVSAVGSLREEIAPGHMVVPDQFIDRTKNRRSTFFGDGIVGHIEFAEPICHGVAERVHAASKKVGATTHEGGTYVCMEGPAFSTKAESHTYRSWGGSVIGMTNLPEAKLAREAEICYATLALATDYDCWREEPEDSVTVEAILEVIRKNVETAKAVIRELAVDPPDTGGCKCRSALQYAVLTAPDAITPEAKERMSLFLSKYDQ